VLHTYSFLKIYSLLTLLIYLSILISATLILCSIFLSTAKYSETYNIASLIILLYNLPFSLLDIHLSYKILDASLHLIHSHLILCFTYLSKPQFFCIMDPKNLNFQPHLPDPHLLSLHLYSLYSVLLLLILNAFPLRANLYLSSLWLTSSLFSPIKTLSSANIMHYSTYPCISFVTSTITTKNR